MSIHFFHSSQPSIFIWGPGYFKATFQNPSVLGEAHLAVLDPFNLVALHLLTGKPAVSERLATYTHPNEYWNLKFICILFLESSVKEIFPSSISNWRSVLEINCFWTTKRLSGLCRPLFSGRLRSQWWHWSSPCRCSGSRITFHCTVWPHLCFVNLESGAKSRTSVWQAGRLLVEEEAEILAELFDLKLLHDQYQLQHLQDHYQ